jgi:ribonuclease P protein component
MYLEIENHISPLQAGFTVSTRHFKKAVDRNRIRRLMRESYRLQKNNLLNELQENHKSLTIFFIYTGNQLPEYKEVFEKTGSALQRLEKIIVREN